MKFVNPCFRAFLLNFYHRKFLRDYWSWYPFVNTEQSFGLNLGSSKTIRGMEDCIFIHELVL